jgi:glycosyltransferase involved in cell wall biosynthesis
MRIILYNTSSFGGCYDYGRALTQAYQANEDVESGSWWVPINAPTDSELPVRKLFFSDKPDFKSRFLKQAHFILRNLFNPLILFHKLRRQPKSIVIFNDFEQLTAFFWVPLFSWFLKSRHRFVVVLHDPDRDAYPPGPAFSAWSMRILMGLMDAAIYHDYLPDKSYYQGHSKCHFLDLPHGFYPMPEPDAQMFSLLSEKTSIANTVLTIPGNIRPEKNYDLAIRALAELPGHMLLVAGSASNVRIDTRPWKELALQLGVSERVVWVEKYLTEAELAAVIEIADVIVLNYAVSFTSQSGILNVVAPFRKELIVSDGPSSLASVLKKFHVGELVKPGSLSSLVAGLKKLADEEVEVRHQWEDYLKYASWENHVEKAIRCFKKL